MKETTLSLSCPEAARLVLLNPSLLSQTIDRAVPFGWHETAASSAPVREFFWPLREFSIRLIRNRAYPLWLRMFLLGSFCRRLEGLAHGTLGRGVPTLLGDFSAAIASGSLRTSMDVIPASPELQLDILLELVRIRIEKDYLPPRLRETLSAFASGLGIATGETTEDRAARHARAHALYYAPFFARHPHILENCLANTILRGLFPFGERSLDPAARLEPALEFAQLATLFAVVKGLLVGVAGFHRESFSAAHVVQTVQTAFRHFDHCPEFLGQAVELLAARNLNNAAGFTMLLRD